MIWFFCFIPLYPFFFAPKNPYEKVVFLSKSAYFVVLWRVFCNFLQSHLAHYTKNTSHFLGFTPCFSCFPSCLLCVYICLYTSQYRMRRFEPRRLLFSSPFNFLHKKGEDRPRRKNPACHSTSNGVRSAAAHAQTPFYPSSPPASRCLHLLPSCGAAALRFAPLTIVFAMPQRWFCFRCRRVQP